jgi:DNA-directed RNA polymerase subunit H (RpoH/RPB5)
MMAMNQLDMLLEEKVDSSIEKSSSNKKVYIRYYLGKNIRPANLQDIIDDLYSVTETLSKNDTLYVIIKDNINETLMNELINIWERDGIFIIFENIKCLQFNILKHISVPEHTIIDEERVLQIMTKYNIREKNQFPQISRFDPVARAIGLRPGQVCHISRPSKTAISSDYYRLCINKSTF